MIQTGFIAGSTVRGGNAGLDILEDRIDHALDRSMIRATFVGIVKEVVRFIDRGVANVPAASHIRGEQRRDGGGRRIARDVQVLRDGRDHFRFDAGIA